MLTYPLITLLYGGRKDENAYSKYYVEYYNIIDIMLPDALCKHFVCLDADYTTMGEFCFQS